MAAEGKQFSHKSSRNRSLLWPFCLELVQKSDPSLGFLQVKNVSPYEWILASKSLDIGKGMSTPPMERLGSLRFPPSVPLTLS